MESIDILTGQYVKIKLEPASVLTRMAALLLDYFFMTAYGVAILYTFFKVLDVRLYSMADDTLILIFFLLFLPLFFYHFLFESLLGGRTPGKMIVRIKVTKVDGSTAGLLSYFLRWILMPIDMFMSGGVGALLILFSSKHQRLGDMAAGTIVVRSHPNLNLNLDELYFEFPTDYKPSFVQVEQLSEGQIAFISNLLVNPVNKSTTQNSIYNLAQKVKSILKIESGLDDRTFLETIVRDYNYFASLEI